RTTSSSIPYVLPARRNTTNWRTAVSVVEIEEAKVVEWIRMRWQFIQFGNRGQRDPQVFRKRRTNIHELARNRVREDQPRGVEEVPLRRERNEPPPSASTVRVVAQHRVSDRAEMHANLMRAPA